jgi:DNA-binding transcriptional MerR regulator
MAEDTEAFPIDTLVRLVADVLRSTGVEQTNGQVSAAPTERTLRYYRTRGLLDPPAGHRGRTALYVRRHVLQVLAIKRLQAAEVPLHEVQQRLVGRTDAELADIAGVDIAGIDPAVLDVAHPGASTTMAPVAREGRGFWAHRPVTAAARAATGPQPSWPIAGLQLASDVRLTFPSTRELTPSDREALTAAMTSVVACLRERSLLPDQLDIERTTP